MSQDFSISRNHPYTTSGGSTVLTVAVDCAIIGACFMSSPQGPWSVWLGGPGARSVRACTPCADIRSIIRLIHTSSLRHHLPPRLTTFAQFIAVCSSSILAGTLGYAVSFSSPWHGKRRIFERCKPVFIDQLQPSTNSDKLSDGHG